MIYQLFSVLPDKKHSSSKQENPTGEYNYIKYENEPIVEKIR
jgi:hypothetical protein